MRGYPALRLCLFGYLLSGSHAEDNSPIQSHDLLDKLNLDELWKSDEPTDNIDNGDENFHLGPDNERKSDYVEARFGGYNGMINNYPFQDEQNNDYANYGNRNSPRLDANIFPAEAIESDAFLNALPRGYGDDPSQYRAKEGMLTRDPVDYYSKQILKKQEQLQNMYNNVIYKNPSQNNMPEGNMYKKQQFPKMPFQPVVVPDRNSVDPDANIKSPENKALRASLIPEENLIMLHDLPGGKGTITCSKSGEFYHLFNGQDCLVCVCLKESFFKSVKPVCMSCNGCSSRGGGPPYVPPFPFDPVPFPPSPETKATCKPLPANQPFQSPLDPCKVCVCTETSNSWGNLEVTIQCERNRECVLPPDGSTIPPSPDAPIPLKVCDKFPKNVTFPHPHDECKLCECSVVMNAVGQYERKISCHTNPQCGSPEDQGTEIQPTDNCDKYPANSLFTDPYDRCRECRCYYGTDTSFAKQIQCRTKPECVPSPEPMVTPPSDFPDPKTEACSPIPSGVPFKNPLNPCQVCLCSEIVDAYGRPDVLIKCEESMDCETTEEPFTIAPKEPVAPLTCKPLPSGQPFQNPLNPCEICVCVESLYTNERQDARIECRANPECVVPQEVVTAVPIMPDNKPVPLAICAKFPPNVVFPHPREECRLCKCTVEETPYGVPKEHITCFADPECESPEDPVTLLPPEPPVTCKPLPSGKPFQNPLNPCEICVCIETTNMMGQSDVKIECNQNPQCVIPPETSTLPIMPDNKPMPLPTCAQFPPNVVFPHPRDACRLCKCNVQVTAYGVPREHITCFTNPECETGTSPKPWPHAPPGPLPGPSPHESCSPYAPNKPFQHPWDDCQLCVCSEAISVGHITIEVNCFTKPSCCVEPPFQLSDLPSSSTGPYIIRPNSQSGISGPNNGDVEGSIAIGMDGQQVNLKEILDPNNIGHYLKPTGKHGPLSPDNKQHRPGSGIINNIQDQTMVIANNIIPRDPINIGVHASLNADLPNLDMPNWQSKPTNFAVSDQKLINPGSNIYDGNLINPSYKNPMDSRYPNQLPGNKYISPKDGKVLIPGYGDHRQTPFNGNIPHIHGNITPFRPGSYNNELSIDISPMTYPQSNLQSLDDLKYGPHHSYTGGSPGNKRYSGIIRRSGKPSDEGTESEESVADKE